MILTAFFWGVGTLQADGEENPHYTQIKGDALKAVFFDTMMLGEYRLFRGDSQTYTYTEFHFANGTTDYIEGADKREEGLWNIIGDDKICYQYPKSENYRQIYCFLVYQIQGCYYKFSPYDMTLTGPINWDRWTSRAVRKGSGASCADAFS